MRVDLQGGRNRGARVKWGIFFRCEKISFKIVSHEFSSRQRQGTILLPRDFPSSKHFSSEAWFSKTRENANLEKKENARRQRWTCLSHIFSPGGYRQLLKNESINLVKLASSERKLTSHVIRLRGEKTASNYVEKYGRKNILMTSRCPTSISERFKGNVYYDIAGKLRNISRSVGHSNTRI